MTVDDVVIRVRVVAENAKDTIGSVAASLNRLGAAQARLADMRLNFSAGNAGDVINALTAVSALRRELSGGIVLPVRGAESLMSAADSMNGISTADAADGLYMNQATDSDALIAQKQSYYNRLIALVNAREGEVTAALQAKYSERLDRLKETLDAELGVYNARVDEINNLLKQGERQAYEADYRDKIARLSESLKYEHDDANRYELQKELDRLTAEYQAKTARDSLTDERDSLYTQIAAAKDKYAAMAAAVNAAMRDELDSVTAGYEAEITALQGRLEQETAMIRAAAAERNNYYTEAGNFRLNIMRLLSLREIDQVRQTQDTVLALIRSYYGAFAEAGAYLGTAFAAAFADSVSSISANIGGDGGAAQAQGATYNFNQTIQTAALSPSQVARETKNLLENAARLL